jgi:hypothetical protein
MVRTWATISDLANHGLTTHRLHYCGMGGFEQASEGDFCACQFRNITKSLPTAADANRQSARSDTIAEHQNVSPASYDWQSQGNRSEL